ncbi:hypothetical protein [Amycolatopsis vastitatis]|uniref:hypothetical protein n=1 Tax=Amycolatopsis vastitatis TaxID=1905142 RepID=UPI0013044282|nr:hypothetical protein [Amycolatopsis vastitatis]
MISLVREPFSFIGTELPSMFVLAKAQTLCGNDRGQDCQYCGSTFPTCVERISVF